MRQAFSLTFAFGVCAVFAALALPAAAAPHPYTLDAAKSQVGFSWDMGADHITGQMPVASADLAIDFDHVANSKVNVVVDVAGAQAGFPFATQALKGPKVLDARQFPQISFVSHSITANGKGARVAGDITLHGVTRPIVFDAMIYRQSGSAPGDLQHLQIRLNAVLNRSDFGAVGWADMVGDRVGLDILASIDAGH